jgi:hypothetical protein
LTTLLHTPLPQFQLLSPLINEVIDHSPLVLVPLAAATNSAT